MFGHDKDEDNKVSEDKDNLIHPVSNKPVDEKLFGVNGPDKVEAEKTVDKESKTVEEEDKDIEEIVSDINASTSAETTTDDSSSDDDDDKSSDDIVIPPADEHKDDSSHDSANVPGELMDIKRSALEELSPLIDQLDQTPEEKTNTLLMMIQATDDKSHIPDAFKSAKDIKDEKKRARAMLDIINEINYFTNKK